MSDHQAEQGAATGSDPGKVAIDAVDSALEALRAASKPAPAGGTESADTAVAATGTSTAARTEADAKSHDDADRKTGETVTIEPPRRPQDVLPLKPAQQGWQRTGDDFTGAGASPQTEVPSRRPRVAAIAAMLALAVVAGAAGGAFATLGLSQPAGKPAATDLSALQASIARIDNEIVALKAGLDQTTTASLGQLNKSGDRLERIEKMQADTAARLTKLSEGVDRLRVAAATPKDTAAAPPKDITGSVPSAASSPAPAAAAPAAAPQGAMTAAAQTARLPTVEGWVLRDARQGTALIEGRTGLYQVYAGDPVPGLGRIDAIRKQDGRWVVVTSRGLVVAR